MLMVDGNGLKKKTNLNLNINMELILENPDIDEIRWQDLNNACLNGNLKFIKQELKYPKNLESFQKGEHLVALFSNSNLELFKFAFKKRCDIYHLHSAALKICADFKNKEIWEYLVFEKQINLTESLQNHLENTNNDYILNFFKIRNSLEYLEKNNLSLNNNEKETKAIKKI